MWSIILHEHKFNYLFWDDPYHLVGHSWLETAQLSPIRMMSMQIHKYGQILFAECFRFTFQFPDICTLALNWIPFLISLTVSPLRQRKQAVERSLVRRETGWHHRLWNSRRRKEGEEEVQGNRNRKKGCAKRMGKAFRSSQRTREAGGLRDACLYQ